MGILHNDHLVQRGDQGPVADGRGFQGDPPSLHQPRAALDKLLLTIQQRHHYGFNPQHRARQVEDVICTHRDVSRKLIFLEWEDQMSAASMMDLAYR